MAAYKQQLKAQERVRLQGSIVPSRVPRYRPQKRSVFLPLASCPPAPSTGDRPGALSFSGSSSCLSFTGAREFRWVSDGPGLPSPRDPDQSCHHCCWGYRVRVSGSSSICVFLSREGNTSGKPDMPLPHSPVRAGSGSEPVQHRTAEVVNRGAQS